MFLFERNRTKNWYTAPFQAFPLQACDHEKMKYGVVLKMAQIKETNRNTETPPTDRDNDALSNRRLVIAFAEP